MDISMFFEFPGLLITIGAVLLILSIVLLILAFKTSDNPESLEAEEPKENSVVEEIKKETKVENDKSDDKALPEETEVSLQLENTGIMDAIQNTSDEKENTTDLEEDEDYSRNTWDAMTDGMYGDMPDGFDDDYDFLG